MASLVPKGTRYSNTLSAEQLCNLSSSILICLTFLSGHRLIASPTTCLQYEERCHNYLFNLPLSLSATVCFSRGRHGTVSLSCIVLSWSEWITFTNCLLFCNTTSICCLTTNSIYLILSLKFFLEFKSIRL